MCISCNVNPIYRFFAINKDILSIKISKVIEQFAS